ARLFGRPAPNLQVGRYILREQLGSGGLGVVHAAHDPRLDREVAIKLLRHQPGRKHQREQTRLLREGQAIARLSHPNVVEVFDVGTYEGLYPPDGAELDLPPRGVFVVMGRLEGQTLQTWFEHGPRPWAQVLETMLAAGRGLAAAHAAGLVHRDFKPANVFVENDGRIRVLDFGLARPRHGSPPSTTAPLFAGTSSRTSTEALETITRTGAVLGTPAFMAPEQHAGRNADARSDQYSFCATLYRGLFGVLPFAGDDLESIASAKHDLVLSRPMGVVRIPGWLNAAMLRGLSPNPRDRWPSMAALLRALSPAQRNRDRWRRLWMGAGALVASVVGGAFIRGNGSHCTDDPAWTPASRAAVEAGLSPHDAGRSALSRVTTELEDYGQRWDGEHRAVCEASAANPEEPSLDVRMACIRARRAHYDALVDLLANADTDVAGQATLAVTQLPAVETCRDPEGSRAELGPQTDPAELREVVALRGRISAISAHMTAGKVREALAMAEALVPDAEAQAVPSLLAEAHWWEGHLRRISGDLEGALPRLEQASMTARACGHDKIAALAGVEMTTVLGNLARYDEALEWARHAEAAAIRYGRGHYPEARVYTAKGSVLRQLGRTEQAYLLYQRAMDVQVRADPNSPELPTILNNLGTAALGMGETAEAHRHYSRSYNELSRLLGPDHPQTVGARMNLGITTAELGLREEARAHYLAARKGFVQHFGPDDVRVAYCDTNLGDLLLELGRLEAARTRFSAGRDVFAKALGPEHPNTAVARAGWGMAQLHLGRSNLARDAITRALADLREALGEEHAKVGVVAIRLAQVDLAEGNDRAAVSRLTAAIDLLASIKGERLELEEARFHLARARWQGGNQAMAWRLAQQAREQLLHIAAGDAVLAEVERWLAAHPPP
ncbi:MAG: serine/threonine-protein kinase, partial [Deltaproteobacteria bacterium]|nr:serine/threonine-protein kinase [Deltaproteobacteria bacterium]